MKKIAVLALMLVLLCAIAMAEPAKEAKGEGVVAISAEGVVVESEAPGLEGGSPPEGVAAEEAPVPTLYEAPVDDEMPADRAAMARGAEEAPKGPVADMNGTLVQVGLYNALQNVKNENARAALERNMQRFLEKYQARLAKMESVDVKVDNETGKLEVRAKEPVKFLGFIKGKATKRFELDNNGQMTEKQPWYRFLYAEEKTAVPATTE